MRNRGNPDCEKFPEIVYADGFWWRMNWGKQGLDSVVSLGRSYRLVWTMRNGGTLPPAIAAAIIARK